MLLREKPVLACEPANPETLVGRTLWKHFAEDKKWWRGRVTGYTKHTKALEMWPLYQVCKSCTAALVLLQRSCVTKFLCCCHCFPDSSRIKKLCPYWQVEYPSTQPLEDGREDPNKYETMTWRDLKHRLNPPEVRNSHAVKLECEHCFPRDVHCKLRLQSCILQATQAI
jgi:hypothetical protein